MCPEGSGKKPACIFFLVLFLLKQCSFPAAGPAALWVFMAPVCALTAGPAALWVFMAPVCALQAQQRFGGEVAVRRSRELAAIQAQREVERMKLEDQRKQIEAVSWALLCHSLLSPQSGCFSAQLGSQ